MNPKDRPEIPALERGRIVRPTGRTVWHDGSQTRFAVALPTSVKGPIRARAHRATRDPNALAVDPQGTPQLPSATPPPRSRAT